MSNSQEWSNPWNPFNSAKVLLWKEHLQACADEDYLPPVTVDIDPSNKCMYNCPHCNTQLLTKNKPQTMTEEHMIKLVDFLAGWRDLTRHRVPNSACVSGGGESFMNPNLVSLYNQMYKHGMEIGIITTGFIMREEHVEAIARAARWIGFSVDAANGATYNRVKGLKGGDSFMKVQENIRRVVKRVRDTDSKCDVAFKFLLTPDNALEVYDAIRLAKTLGVHDFHLRPAGWDHLPGVEQRPAFDPLLIDQVNKQIAEGMKLEDKGFKVYGIRHKFNPDFSRRVAFSRCWAIPMLPTFGADGNVHLCFDRRGDKDLFLCKHVPDPAEILKVWNTEAHKELVRSINPEKDCPRCTFGSYNQMVEEVIIKDSMCMQFP